MAKKLRCFVGLHRYQNLRSAEGDRYKQCRDCDKFQDQSATAIGVRRRRNRE